MQELFAQSHIDENVSVTAAMEVGRHLMEKKAATLAMGKERLLVGSSKVNANAVTVRVSSLQNGVKDVGEMDES